MDVSKAIKWYYLKFALPIVIVALLIENAFTPESYVGQKLGSWVLAGNASKFFLERGGQRSSQRGRQYFAKVHLNIYEGEKGKTLPLKKFMTQ